MIRLETQNFNINRILCLLLGIWPYRKSLLIKFQLIICFGILVTCILFQFTVFVTPCTPNIILKVLSSSLFLVCMIIKYNSFLINSDMLKNLFERLQNVCDELKDENEIAIIEQYEYKAKRYTIGIILLGVFSECVFLMMHIWPHMTFLHFTNSSLHFSNIIVTEYFIDRERYSHLIEMHQLAALWIGGLSMVATGSYLITYLQHTCGMFCIASYRIEQALITDISQKNILKDEKQICIEIIRAIDMHRKALEFNEFFISSFESSFFSLITIGLTTLVVNLLLVTINTKIEQLFLPFVTILIVYVYLFLANYIAQQITDHNEYVFTTVYNVQWYVAPVQIQKMILFLLQRGTKSFHLVLGGLFVASMESAASALSVTVSFFTVFYSKLHNY